MNPGTAYVGFTVEYVQGTGYKPDGAEKARVTPALV